MKKQSLYLLFFISSFFFACKSSITPRQLYGKWNYSKLENPNKNPPTAEPDWKLKIVKPYILFTKENDLQIWWSGAMLSHGKFRTKGQDIWFNEVLEDGQKREFPFHVTALDAKTIVFETSGEDGSRVTAVKQ